MRKIGNIILGLFLVALGVIFACNAVFDTNINIFFDGWWTLFIIVPCFVGLFKEGGKKGNLIGIAIGVILLLAAQGIITYGLIWKLILPVILVVIGLTIIFKDVLKTKINKEIKKINDRQKENGTENIDHSALFSSLNLNFAEEEFTGADLSATFGGVKCDLGRAHINNDVVINAEAIFGGIDIVVPENVNVKVKSNSLFGGVSNNRKSNNDGTYTVYVNATCMFGGVEIK